MGLQLWLVALVAWLFVIGCGAVDPVVFEQAYAAWSDHQRTVAKTYGSEPVLRKAGTPSPPAVVGRQKGSRKGLGAPASSSTSSSDDDDSEDDTPQVPAYRVYRRRNAEAGGATPRSNWPLTYPLKSFTKACAKQSELLCNEANPFKATYCLVSNKASLSQSCAEYVTAKVNCFMTARKLCPEQGTSHLKCLYEHRADRRSLPALCSKTAFFEYISGGVSNDDELNEKLAQAVVADGV